MEREVGGGIGMGNTCKPMAVSFQCMTKSTTIKKERERERHVELRQTEPADQLPFRTKLEPENHQVKPSLDQVVLRGPDCF